MNDRQTLEGTSTECRVLYDALQWYRQRAEARYQPGFVPKPGKKDRNLEIMRITDIILPHLREGESELMLVTDYDSRRLMRNALEAYGAYVSTDPAVIDCDADTALELMNRIPYTYVEKGGRGQSLTTTAS